jgi:hypothetical protein
MAYHSTSNNATQRTIGGQTQTAPTGYHYMPDGSLMADADHINPPSVRSRTTNKIITGIDIDFNDIKEAGETRKFIVLGTKGAIFSLEVTYPEIVFTDATCDYNNDPTIAHDDDNGKIEVGMLVSGTGIPDGATVDSVASNNLSFELSASTTGGSVTNGTLTFTREKKYYNFNTNLFQTTITGLNNVSTNGTYTGNIIFPKVPNPNKYYANKYDIFLFAESIYGTKHSRYTERRFADGSIDINSSSGSNSNLVQKVIYQTLDVDIIIRGISPNSTITHQGAIVTQTITTSRGKNIAKIPFSIPWTVTNTRTLTIGRQPNINDIATYVTRVIGVDPVEIPGENIARVVSGTSTTNGSEDGTTAAVVIDATVTDVLAIGDRVTGPDGHAINDLNLTVISHDSSNTFTCDQNFPVTSDETTLTFANQKNRKWSLDNIYGLKHGMRIYATNTTGTANGFTGFATIKDYLTQLTVFEGERNEYKIDDVNLLGIVTYSIKPTITRNTSTHVTTTTQLGDIIFSQQAKNAFGGQSVNIYGYGRSEINNLTEYDIEFSDLKVALSEVTTLVKGAVSASATVEVDSGVGIKENISTVSGIGINPAVIAPTVSRLTDDGGSSTWASGAARLTLTAAQTLEDNMPLIFSGASTVATITGNIKVNKVGNADVKIYFDLERFLTMQAANA